MSAHQIATCALQTLPTGPEGEPPKRLCLLSAPDGLVKGKDGRAWHMGDPLAVLQYLQKRGNPLTIDENHAEERRAPQGLSSPALARVPVETITVNAQGELWGVPEWTPYGRECVKGGSYLGLSPAIVFDTTGKDDTLGIMGTVKGLSSAGLVNSPNLDLPASLNNAGHPLEENNHMDPKEFRKLLGLPEGASDQDVQAKVAQISAAQPQVVPVEPAPAQNSADDSPPAWATALNEQVAALSASVEKIQSVDTGSHEIAVNSAIQRFLTEGKILPTAVEYHKGLCSTAEGLGAFVKYHESAPVLVALNAVQPEASPKALPPLTPEQDKLRQSMGMSVEEFHVNYEDVK